MKKREGITNPLQNLMAVFYYCKCDRTVLYYYLMCMYANNSHFFFQRLYNAITSPNPPAGPPYVSSTNFASLRAGPGSTKPVHGPDGEGVPGVTTYRVTQKDRTFVEEVHFKGWSVRLGDWVHLSNPDDPGRPTIAQVFRCWVSEEP